LSNFRLSKTPKAERSVKAINIKNAKSIGIVYLASDEETNDLVRRYVKYLKDYKVKIQTLGYYVEKELPPDVNPKLEFDFITKKDLNLRLEPKCPLADNFIKESFDLLIDVSVDENEVIRYLMHHSVATFKVGAASLSYSNLLDLTIMLKPEEGVRQLMKNIDKYLHELNK
jgi:hypothetical protein